MANITKHSILHPDKNKLDTSNKFSGYAFVDVNAVPEDEKKQFTPATGEQLYSAIGTIVTDYVKLKHPSVINWVYNEKDLLSENIDMDAFLANPDDFKALKTMFELAGINNIPDSLKKNRAGNYHKLNNYLKKIASKTTEHFRNVWEEYADVEFTLTANGNTIVTGIKEKNTFTFQQRSDGFKRFVTFLLMISAVYEINNLNDALLLIDEPDLSLHPSGIRYLRDELINISADNNIVASTHSIFLIDNKNISRHYIVKKENEITKIETANDENLITEEVLFNALGFSFFEVLKKENLVFEGWRDKELFKKALEKVPAEFKEIKDTLKSIGIAHINGVKEGQSITPIFELTSRKLVIISDSDEVAIQHQTTFEKNKSYGKWLTYKQIYPEFEGKTGEDFLKKEYIRATIALFRKSHPELVAEFVLNDNDTGITEIIDKWLRDNCLIEEKAKRKELIQEVKNLLFNNLKSSSIDASYYQFLLKLNKAVPEYFLENREG